MAGQAVRSGNGVSEEGQRHGGGRRAGTILSAPASGSRPPRSAVRAEAGDRLVIRGHQLGQRARDAEILEVLGDDGGPPFRVRWSDSGREAILYPGPDARVEHFAHAAAKGRRGRT
jgi:hypothetical protein